MLQTVMMDEISKHWTQRQQQSCPLNQILLLVVPINGEDQDNMDEDLVMEVPS